MPAYLLLIAALLSRAVPHAGWYGFTAVGGSLLYFGAKRSWKEMLLPVAAMAALDYYLTTHVYAYDFLWQDYLITWAWYAAVIVLGALLLRQRTTVARVAAGTLLCSTSFFMVTDYAVWAAQPGMYPHTFAGLMNCYVAALPFYRNDLVSTAIVAGLAFGIPQLIKQHEANKQTQTL